MQGMVAHGGGQGNGQDERERGGEKTKSVLHLFLPPLRFDRQLQKKAMHAGAGLMKMKRLKTVLHVTTTCRQSATHLKK